MDITGRELRLERTSEAPAKARRWVERSVGHLPCQARDDVTLLTHELVTNAVEHSEGGRIWLALLRVPKGIRVEVADEGGTTDPALLPPEPYATSGRGLHWVSQIADSWGIERGHATSVWFQIDLPEDGSDLSSGDVTRADNGGSSSLLRS